MYETILLPTDGSDAGEGAVENAFDLARQYGATVHVIHVVEPFYTLNEGLTGMYDVLEREGQQVLDDLAARAEEAGIDAVTELRMGTPHEEILDYAEEHDADVVVMGTHGRTGLDRYLVGSVAERVVRLCDAPVLTVHPPAEA